MRKPIVLQNTVVKGIHQDNIHQFQPPDTARRSVNGRIIDNNDGSFAWENLKGNTITFNLSSGFKPIGHIELVDKIIIFSTDDTTAIGGDGEIGVLQYGSSGLSSYDAIYYSNDLKFSTRYLIEGFGLKETDDIERIYFTDNFNFPRVLNIQDFYPPLTNTGPFVSGITYLVVNGGLTYSTTDYLPGDTFNYTSGAVTGSGTCVIYKPANILNFSPEITNIPILSFRETITGDLKESTYFFAVRYGLNSGYVTPFMSITNPISVFDNKTGATDIDAYQASIPNSDGGITNIGLTLHLSNIDQDFDYFEIVAFEASNWDEVKSGVVAYREDITIGAIDIDITKDYGFGSLGVEDIIINPIAIDTIKTMTMIKNRSSIGHIKERNELDIGQEITGNLYSEVYELPTDQIGTINYTVTSPHALAGNKDKIPSTKLITNGDIIPGQWYRLGAGTIRYPIATGTVYTPGDVFQGEDNKLFWDLGTDEQVNAIIRIKKYYDLSNSEIIYDDYTLEDWYDYKSRMIADKMVGYWDDKYRIGILPIDKRGNAMYPRWIGDIDIPVRQVDENDTNTFGATGAGTRTPVSAEILNDRATGSSNPYDYTYNLKVMSIIINDILDLTDIIDDISAFMIVRAPRTKQSKFEAVMHPIDANGEVLKIVGTTSDRLENWYKLYSPDQAIGISSVSETEDQIIMQRHVAPSSQTAYVQEAAANYATHAKMYTEYTVGSRVAIGESNDILKSYPMEVDLDPTTPATYGDLEVINIDDTNNPCEVGTLIKTKRAEDGVDLPTTGFGNMANDCVVVKVQQKSLNEYGGDSSQALQETEYQTVGHLQIVDQAFKDAIEDTGTWIVNSIQIFGGDCFVGIWSYLHSYNFLDGTTDINNEVSVAYHIPLQSRVNIALVGGRSFARLRYETSTNIGGINYSDTTGPAPGDWELDQVHWEDRTYSTGFSNELYNFGLVYPGLPSNFSQITIQDKKTRFSEVKYNGADIDVFRKYLADNERDLNYEGGALIALRSRGDRLYYWQEKTVGYIPVSERALKNSDIGFPIQLGVGGIFERNDDVHKTYGCRHQWSIIETDKGFAWCDFERRAIVHMSYDFGLREDSEVLGLKLLIRNIDQSILESDSPMYDKGIISGYNYITKEIYMTFRGTTSITVIINSDKNMWVGELIPSPLYYISKKDFLITSNGSQSDMYKSNSGDYGVFYSSSVGAQLEIILNSQVEVKKFFMNARSIGGKNFFDQVKFEMWYDENLGTFEQSVTEVVLDNAFFEYLYDAWDFSFPLQDNGEWFKGHFMKLTFIINPANRKLIKFIKLLTQATEQI